MTNCGSDDCIALHIKHLKRTAGISLAFLAVESDYLIAAACVVENLQQIRTIRSQNQLNEQNEFNENLSTISAQFFPTNVEQTKPLGSD